MMFLIEIATERLYNELAKIERELKLKNNECHG